jgi:gamma-glutamyltranspeptidase/glutathione hydrolase
MDTINNLVNVSPGNPYEFTNEPNPYLNLLNTRKNFYDTSKRNVIPLHDQAQIAKQEIDYQDRLHRGTTTVEAADKDGWVVSITPSGGWLPACIAGKTGVGMSQRMQSFVLDSTINPFNVVAPGKKPRVTLTPSLALKNGAPYLAFGVQGGDTQDQNLLQFFLNMVEFSMTVQQAAEAANFNTNQLWLSLGGNKMQDRMPRNGDLMVNKNTPESIRVELRKRGYKLSFEERSSGPINAIFFDWKHGSMWGGSSNHGEDYGIGW